jgi:hypothetical protein
MPGTTPSILSHDTAAAIDAVRALSEELTKMVNIARALVDTGRAIDLTGIDSQVGLLCAKSLDLPTGDGRRIRPRLIALFGSMEALAQVIASNAPRFR